MSAKIRIEGGWQWRITTVSRLPNAGSAGVARWHWRPPARPLRLRSRVVVAAMSPSRRRRSWSQRRSTPRRAPSAAASIPGRTVDADDVVYSWDRFKAHGSAIGRQDLVNDVAPTAPIQSMTRIDARTVQFKLVRPFAPLLITLARPNAGYFYIM